MFRFMSVSFYLALSHSLLCSTDLDEPAEHLSASPSMFINCETHSALSDQLITTCIGPTLDWRVIQVQDRKKDLQSGSNWQSDGVDLNFHLKKEKWKEDPCSGAWPVFTFITLQQLRLITTAGFWTLILFWYGLKWVCPSHKTVK